MLNASLCILYTGGTIGMCKTHQGYKPIANWLEHKLKTLGPFQNPDLPSFELVEYDNLIDSADLMPSHWLRIANDIIKRQNQYDGFIILHGTDTLAYTASALSFLLPYLNKPVICTGSQIPLAEPRNDAIDNILESMLIAHYHPLPEVMIYFHHQLLRGNRTTKVSTSALNAFYSPNYPCLATTGIEIEMNHHVIKSKQKHQSKGLNQLNEQCRLPHVALIHFYPGITPDIFRYYLNNANVDGLILKTYGVGNLPENAEMLNSLSEAIARGTIIVNCSQCPQGGVDMRTYATGYQLMQAGLISGLDMTDEAALTKLFYLLLQNHSQATISAYMTQNLCGELTETKSN